MQPTLPSGVLIFHGLVFSPTKVAEMFLSAMFLGELPLEYAGDREDQDTLCCQPSSVLIVRVMNVLPTPVSASHRQLPTPFLFDCCWLTHHSCYGPWHSSSPYPLIVFIFHIPSLLKSQQL